MYETCDFQGCFIRNIDAETGYDRCLVSPTFKKHKMEFVEKILTISPKGVLKSYLYVENNGYSYMF